MKTNPLAPAGHQLSMESLLGVPKVAGGFTLELAMIHESQTEIFEEKSNANGAAAATTHKGNPPEAAGRNSAGAESAAAGENCRTGRQQQQQQQQKTRLINRLAPPLFTNRKGHRKPRKTQ